MFRLQSKHFVVVVAVVALLVVSKSVDGFATTTTPQRKSQSLTSLSMAQNHEDGQQQNVSTRVAMMGMASFMAAATVFLSPFNTVALALEEDVTSDTTTTTVVEAPKYSISKCSMSPKSPVCISTSNVRQLDLYDPPWTFASNADEAMARLKGAVEGETLNSIVPSEDNTSRHLLVDSKRSKLGPTAYRMEFVINESDGVITFRSSAPEDITGPDFGLQRRRLAEIRERAGSFGVMGEGLNSADSKSTGEKGYGPLGQLKSFYGLQSGAGFEDVLK
jgi:uncharacterized protein (DUF1499 family)